MIKVLADLVPGEGFLPGLQMIVVCSQGDMAETE